MNYRTNHANYCIEQVEAQANTIKHLKASSSEKTLALIEASNQIAQLQGEKQDLTDLLNKLSAELATLRSINHQQRMKLHRVHENYSRRDGNWDSRPTAERINNGEADGE